MKLSKPVRILLLVLAAALLVPLFLYWNGDIGTPKSRLEEDFLSSSHIGPDWLSTGAQSDTLAAFVAWNEDRSDSTFSVYVNRPGFSFGYFFRYGGMTADVRDTVTEFTFPDTGDKAYVSMNAPGAVRVEIDDGTMVQEHTLQPDEPFVFAAFPQMLVTFYDANGNVIEPLQRTL